ncbi:hypothetical protein [Streptosporangium sp. CA-115845]|uniref:hypothetical protein n=1 Tax=Streptosporangium sp. CA-115845 TaxID=3240071 RepID=UPI003D930BB1
MVMQRLRAINGAAPTSDISTRIELRHQIDNLKRALDAAVSLHEVPIELCHTLRAPPGTSHIVELAVDDQSMRVVVSPLGRVDPERELAVWRELLDTAALCTHPGEQLHRMDPAVLAVHLNTATLVVNTGHPRAVMRAAMKLLQPGALVPIPVAWLLDQARTRPGRTTAATAAVVGAAAAALTMTFVSFTAPPQPPRNLPVVAASPNDDQPSPNDADTPAATDPAPTPPLIAFEPAPPPTGDPAPDRDSPDPLDPAPPGKKEERNEDDNSDDAPGSPKPTARPTRSPPPPPDPPARTPRSSSPPDQPTSAARPPAQTSAPDPAPTPTPTPALAPAQTSSPPPPDPTCHVLDIELSLPILGVDVCV